MQSSGILYKKDTPNLVGSYHSKILNEQKDTPLKLVKIDLNNQEQVNTFFQTEKPDYVFLAAAKVGGIHANNTFPAQFIYENLNIQGNIIHAAYEAGGKKTSFPWFILHLPEKGTPAYEGRAPAYGPS